MQNRSIHCPIAIGDGDQPRGGYKFVPDADSRGRPALGLLARLNRQYSTSYESLEVHIRIPLPRSRHPTINGTAAFVVSCAQRSHHLYHYSTSGARHGAAGGAGNVGEGEGKKEGERESERGTKSRRLTPKSTPKPCDLTTCSIPFSSKFS